MQKSNSPKFKLNPSTPTGRRADKDTSIDPQAQALNSVVDHRSVYVKIQLFNQTIEAVCDSGASVSCLSSEIFDSLRSQHKLQLVPSNTQLKAANQLPIECRGIVQLPVRIGSKLFNHAFHVLVKSDCLIGLEFLDDHKCDPMFSKKQI